MTSTSRSRRPCTGGLVAAMAGLLVVVAGCSRSQLSAPEVTGPVALVIDGQTTRFWALTKQAEVRSATAGVSSRSSWTRNDTFFHFGITAFDPVTARPSWTKRLLTIGDSDARGAGPSRVLGSSASGRLLGQDGRVVWLLIDGQPIAVDAADGSMLADAAGIEQRNPGLKGLLPREARYYDFDHGLVLTSADARRLLIHGTQMKATPYLPTPAAAAPTERTANGRERVVPVLPLGEVPTRQVVLAGQWLGLYSETEARDVADDIFGTRLRYPYTVLDEGPQVRRNFWRGRIVAARRFDDSFEKVVDMTPIADAPSFLKGRFVQDSGTGQAMQLDAPAGVLVWHSTRIDSEGRLALTRLDGGLRSRWTAELPLSESSLGNPLSHWLLAGRIVLVGNWQHLADGTVQREPHLVTVQIADGTWRAWNIARDTAAE